MGVTNYLPKTYISLQSLGYIPQFIGYIRFYIRHFRFQNSDIDARTVVITLQKNKKIVATKLTAMLHAVMQKNKKKCFVHKWHTSSQVCSYTIFFTINIRIYLSIRLTFSFFLSWLPPHFFHITYFHSPVFYSHFNLLFFSK